MAITSCCPVRCYWSWIFVSAALASSCDGCHRLMPTLTPRVLPLIAAAKMLNQTYLTVSTNTRREKEDANRCTFFRRRNVSLKVMLNSLRTRYQTRRLISHTNVRTSKVSWNFIRALFPVWDLL